MNIDVIGRADQGRFTEIRATGKQGIESLQVGMVWIFVTTGDVRFQPKPWFEGSFFERETHLGSSGPRLNVPTSEAAELINELEIVVPTGFAAPDSRSQRMPL